MDAFVTKYKHIKEIKPVTIKSTHPFTNPQFLNKAFGNVKDPAPKAQAIKAKILARKEPGFKGPKYLVKQFLSKFLE